MPKKPVAEETPEPRRRSRSLRAGIDADSDENITFIDNRERGDRVTRITVTGDGRTVVENVQ